MVKWVVEICEDHCFFVKKHTQLAVKNMRYPQINTIFHSYFVKIPLNDSKKRVNVYVSLWLVYGSLFVVGGIVSITRILTKRPQRVFFECLCCSNGSAWTPRIARFFDAKQTNVLSTGWFSKIVFFWKRMLVKLPQFAVTWSFWRILNRCETSKT